MASTMMKSVTLVAPTSALSSKKATPAKLSAISARPVATRPTVVLAQADAGRREVALAGMAAIAATVLPVGKANAGLFGGKSREEIYADQTTALITEILTTITLPRDDETRGDAIKHLKGSSNEWVAKYRRDNSVSGRPSYGYTYSAVNAVQGHYTNFGTKAPIPKKRAERIVKELKDAQVAIGRGR
uniref:Photosystem II Psb27 protein n=1 Tax=Pyramimonas obovata TaxID=1411642 RepID=A0A7S0N6G5_9CHLO|mmetsp:Transcript_20702/g.45354  ORF Transcript_20702/g.45354 Transcript_20702/m.45354 type:complete len:187 (+) Transcript_20702:84-644(+)|eukprot:CAMPEP_0118933166 /NCGR_PEP_ID=MMETSP1169-20130426/11475_1 /TAXON_ID=36882 /ORGANISM="Pyramimonas obovata, Strain CCMP722" /LENGTH=186 /DNA_ID=CAMNT_0006875899 /DNA_START=70 /DNA_END=630 /DNA_ORIENTATION=+